MAGGAARAGDLLQVSLHSGTVSSVSLAGEEKTTEEEEEEEGDDNNSEKSTSHAIESSMAALRVSDGPKSVVLGVALTDAAAGGLVTAQICLGAVAPHMLRHAGHAKCVARLLAASV